MKQIKFRHFSGHSIKIEFSTTNIAHPGGEINFCFIEASLRGLLHQMQKQFFGYIYPRGESQELCGDLTNSDHTDSVDIFKNTWIGRSKN